MSAEKKSRKDMLREYREARETGGVYAIFCAATGKRLIQSTMTIAKAENQLAFAKVTGSCVHPLLADDWKTHGPDAFAIELLETLDRKETQTPEEFRDDVRAMEGLWREKLENTPLY